MKTNYVKPFIRVKTLGSTNNLLAGSDPTLTGNSDGTYTQPNVTTNSTEINDPTSVLSKQNDLWDTDEE
jgi:hypothetical protein